MIIIRGHHFDTQRDTMLIFSVSLHAKISDHFAKYNCKNTGFELGKESLIPLKISLIEKKEVSNVS